MLAGYASIPMVKTAHVGLKNSVIRTFLGGRTVC
jgi:hypothetical protein